MKESNQLKGDDGGQADRPAEHAAVARSVWDLVLPLVATVHLLVGLGLAARASLWGDEAFTAQSVRQPLTHLLGMLTRIDVNMAAYYLSAKGWTSAFGYSELALRSLSLVFSTSTVICAGLLMRRWFSPSAAAVTAIGLGLNPFFLIIGLTARDFSMLALATTLSLAAFVAAIESPTQPRWLLVAFLDLLALYTSLLAALAIVTQAAFVLIARRRLAREHLVAAVVLAIGALPAIAFLAPANTLNWLGKPSLASLIALAWEANGGRPLGLALALLTVVGLLLRPRMSRDEATWRRMVLPAMTIGPLALMLALLPYQSLFTAPYLTLVLVPAAMLAGAVGGSWRWLAPVALVALLISGVAGITAKVVPTPALAQQDWRTAMATLNSHATPGDSVTFPNTFYRVAGEYYEQRGGAMSLTQPVLPSFPWFSQPPDTYDRIKRTGLYRDPRTVAAAVNSLGRLWLIGPDDTWMQEITVTLQRMRWKVVMESRPAGLVVRELISPQEQN